MRLDKLIDVNYYIKIYTCLHTVFIVTSSKFAVFKIFLIISRNTLSCNDEP